MPEKDWNIEENTNEGERLHLPDDLSGSFSAKLRRGWTKEQLMRYYVLSEAKYEKVVTFLSKMGTITRKKTQEEKRDKNDKDI